MGTPAFAATCLRRILSTAHPVVGVVTRPDRPAGRGHKLHRSAVKELALEHGIEVLEPERANDQQFLERLRRLAPDLGVVVAYGRMLPRSVIDVPRLGCINAHASLLPRLRGAAPIEHAILAGFAATGVTIMQIDDRMDAGDMIMARTVSIDDDVDAGMLRERLADVAAQLLVEALEALASGTATFEHQDETQATYAPALETEDARIDWSLPVARVGRIVRAFRPRPGAFTSDGERRLKVLAARPAGGAATAAPGTILAVDDSGMLVACGDGTLLVEVVQPQGRRPMSAAAYLRGCGKALPRRLGRDSAGRAD